MATPTIPDKNLNMVVVDDNDILKLKPVKVKFISKSYLTDGTQKLLEDDMLFGMTDCRKNDPIKPGSPKIIQEDNPPYCYCANDGKTMTGIFFDYYPADDLKNDSKARTDFNAWFLKVCMDWMTKNGLKPESKDPPDKQPEYVKVIGKVSIPATPTS